MDPVKRYYILLLAFTPLLEYLFVAFLGRSFVLFYGSVGTALLFVIFFSSDYLHFPKYLIPLVLLIIYYFGWDLVNGHLNTFKSGILSYLYSNLWLHTLTFLLIVENSFFDEKFIRTIILVFKVTVAVSFGVSLVQFTVDPYFLIPEEISMTWAHLSRYEIRLNSIFAYDSSVGSSFIPIVSILVGYFLFKNEKLNYSWLVMAAFVAFANKSRYVYLNFLIVLFQYPLVRGFQLKKVMSTLIITAIILTFFIGLLSYLDFDMGTFVSNRLLSDSASTRILAIEMFTRFFPKNPLFGSGVRLGEDLIYALGGRSSQIHVGYLSHLYEFGMVGSLILFSLLYMVLLKLYQNARFTGYYGSLFAFICLLVTNLTGVDFSFFHYGLLFIFIFDKYISDIHHNGSGHDRILIDKGSYSRQ